MLSRNTVRVVEVARESLALTILLYNILYMYYIKEASFIGKKGWAVNSIVITFKSSNLLPPNKELVT